MNFVHFCRIQQNKTFQITLTRFIQDLFLIFFAILCLKYLCTTPHIFRMAVSARLGSRNILAQQRWRARTIDSVLLSRGKIIINRNFCSNVEQPLWPPLPRGSWGTRGWCWTSGVSTDDASELSTTNPSFSWRNATTATKSR